MGPFNYALLSTYLGARHGRELPLRDSAPFRRGPRRRAVAVGQRIAPQQVLLDDQRHHVDDRLRAARRPARHAPTPSGWARRVYVDNVTGTVRATRRQDVLALRGLNARSALRRRPTTSRAATEPYVLRSKQIPTRRERHDLEQPGDRQAAVHEELRLDGVLAPLRLHVLQRLAAERPADHVRGLCGLLFAGLRAELAHARRQRAVPESDQRSEPRERSSFVRYGEQYPRQQPFYAVSGEVAAPIVSAANPYERHLLRHDRVRGVRFRPTASSQQAGLQSGTASTRRWRSIVRAQSATVPAPNLARLYAAAAARARTCLPRTALHATYNQVVPKFFSASLTDEFRPTDKWLLTWAFGLDSFTFEGSNTDYR